MERVLASAAPAAATISIRRIKAHHLLIAAGIVSAAMYFGALAHGRFRPGRMEPFFPIFGVAFACYALACWLILRSQAAHNTPSSLRLIFGFALVFNVILLFSPPTLSDDMYRYMWDGRVQGSGFNPYQYASDAPELAHLRDRAIWREMNRPDAHTIYPPFAQLIFAATWRIFGDSVIGFKVVFIGAVFLAAWLLVKVLQRFDLPPERVIIFLWHPLLIFEIAHAAHVDALYLPLVVAAFLVRLQAPTNRVSPIHEAGIGVLLGLATLIKLYPAFLAAPLWSVRDGSGRRRWRIAFPIAMLATIGIGYLLYSAPNVNVFGFLSDYSREFFNVSPEIMRYINFMAQFRIPWYRAVTPLMFILIALISLFFWLIPAHTARGAVLRCATPIGIYLVVNVNLFSWYMLWMLPLVTLSLRFIGLNAAFAWWIFSGLIALSYTFFLSWQFLDWALHAQYYPLYALLIVALVLKLREFVVRRQHQKEKLA